MRDKLVSNRFYKPIVKYKMYKVLVINPYITDFKLYDEWMHPLGLYFLIDSLKRNHVQTFYFNCLKQNTKPKKYGTGHFECVEIEKPLLYENIKRKYKLYGCEKKELVDYLLSVDVPDLICVGSMMTYWSGGVIETVRIVKEMYPDKPVIIGGIAARLIPEFFEKKLPDCFTYDSILASNEINIPETVYNALKALKEPISFLGGLECLKQTNHGPLLLSLGCPLRCSYCASSVLQKHYYHRSLQTIIDEVQYLYENFDVRDFAFYDDAVLLESHEVLIPFLKKINEHKFSVRFHSPNGLHVRLITQEISDLLMKNGFRTIRFGFESGNKKYTTDTNAKSSFDMLREKVAVLRRSGFGKQDIGVYIMGGLKGQEPQEMVTEIEYTSSLGVKVKPVFLSPVPCTAMFEYYSKIFPEIKTDPLWHNDTFFVTQLPQWSSESIEQIRLRVRELNNL